MKNLHLALIMSLFCTQSIPVVAQSSRSVTGIWENCLLGRTTAVLTIRVFSGNGYTVHSAYTASSPDCKNLKPIKIGIGSYQIDRQGKVFTTEGYYGNSALFHGVCQPLSSSRMKCQSESGNLSIWKKIRD